MIRSIRLLVFACILAMAHGAYAEERIGIRSHDDVGWLRGLDNAHVLVQEITEYGKKNCGLTKEFAEKEFVSAVNAIPVTTLKEGDEVDNIFFISNRGKRPGGQAAARWRMRSGKGRMGGAPGMSSRLPR